MKIDHSLESAASLSPSETVSPRTSRAWEAAAVASILLFAAAVRLVGIDTLPPGLHQDEAVYLVDAESIRLVGPHLYYGEREPLYMYFVAGATYVLGLSPLAARVTAALFSLAEVAIGGALARRLFGREVGLITAAGLATSLWLTALGRTGFRAIALPAVECLGFLLLWRALQSGRMRDYALGGAILGLSLYTYLNARFIPIALLVFVVLAAVFYRPWLRKRFAGLVVAAAFAVAVCIPLGLYGYRHPEIFFGRPDQVALPGGAEFLPALLDSSLRTLGMIAIQGDPTWRHNLSGAPVLDWLNAIFFAVGLGVAAWRRGPMVLFVLVTLVIMLVPGMLSIDSPHFLRTNGAVGSIYAIWALGVGWSSTYVGQALRSSPAQKLLGVAMIALPIAVAAARDGVGYFVTYANSQDMPASYNVQLAAAGHVLAQSPLWRTSRSNVYVSDAFKQDRASVAAFLYPLMSASERERWLDEDVVGTFFPQRDLVPLPASPSLYILSDDRNVVDDALGTTIRRESRVDVGDGKAITVIEAGPSPSPPVWSPLTNGPIHFGKLLTLEGAAVGSAPGPGSATPTIVLKWRADGSPPYPPSIFVHVEDSRHRTLAQSDLQISLPAAEWQAGREWVTYHRPRLPAGTMPGDYEITVGVYDKASGVRETAVANGRPLLSAVAAGLALSQPVGGVAEVGRRYDANVAPGLTLLGAEPLPAHAEAGTSLPISLVWRAIAGNLVDYDVTASVATTTGAVNGDWRGPVGETSYPTSRWANGATIRQTIDISIPATGAGGVSIAVRVQPHADSATVAPDHPSVELGRIIVDASQHDFAVPRTALPLDARFGAFGQLVGYDGPSAAVHAGGTLDLTLAWKALQPSDTAFTVFVHVLDARDHIVGQRDEAPDHGARPTTSWVAGEYLVDSHELTIDPSIPGGIYRIEVGLYDPATGARVPTADGADHAIIGSVQVLPR
jgi:4-amino-4-deoxy-L-arabinose transferase-like glycosyltransferase